MLKFLTALLLIFSWNLSSQEIAISQDIAIQLVDENGHLTPLLKSLLKLDHINAATLDEAVEATQQRWYAAKQGLNGIERCDLIDPPEYQAIKEDVIKICRKLGLFEARNPVLQHYDYAICLGAFLEAARERLASVINSWKEGVRFDWLIFLGADRPLRNQPGNIEDRSVLCDQDRSSLIFRKNWKLIENVNYKTETDMMKLIWDQADIPEDMKMHLSNRVIFIDAKTTIAGRRPSTGDTYIEWLRLYHPPYGTILASSSPVVAPYQHLVGMNILGKNYFLNTVSGPADESSLRVVVIFDTLAKCLFEIQKQQKQNFVTQSNMLR